MNCDCGWDKVGRHAVVKVYVNSLYYEVFIVWEIKIVLALLFKSFMLLKTFFDYMYVNPSPKAPKAPCEVYCSLWACCPIFLYNIYMTENINFGYCYNNIFWKN